MFNAATLYRGKPAVIGTLLDVTERKQVENRIRESEANLRTIMDSVYDAVFIHDLDGTILDVNEKMLELYRVSREQALHARIVEDFSAPDNPFDKVPAIWESAVSGEDQFFEWKARRPNDGSVYDVEVFLHKITLQARPLILANVRDITARKRAEDALRRSETNYREIFDSVNDAIFVHDITTGDVLSANRKSAEMFGYSQEEFRHFISESLFTGLPGLYRAGRAEMAPARDRRPPADLRMALEEKERRAVLGGGQPQARGHRRGDPAARHCPRNNGTETNTRGSETDKGTARRSPTDRRDRQLGVGRSDEHGSPGPTRSTVFSICRAGEFKGTFEAIMEMVHPGDRGGIERSLAEATSQRKETSVNEYRIIRPDGSIRIIHARFRLEYDETGLVTVMRGTAQDVTEARHAEEALKLTQFSLDHAAVSAFLY